MQKGGEFPNLNVTTMTIIYACICTKISLDTHLNRPFSHAAAAPAVAKQLTSKEKIENRRYEFNFAFYRSIV